MTVKVVTMSQRVFQITDAAIFEVQLAIKTKSRIMSYKILLGSGVYFDYENPETCQMDIEDVAFGLAYSCRFAGQCRSVRSGRRVFYSVAEHCVRMSHIVPEMHAYSALMHELGEVTCGDIPSPLKMLCPEIKNIEKRCEAAMLTRFKVKIYDKDILKYYDNIMLATERRDLMLWDGIKWDYLGEVSPLEEELIPWSAEDAAVRFLIRYHEVKT